MKTVLMALAISGAFPGIAHAADKPAIGPAPAWVKAVPMPKMVPKGEETPVRLLLSDQQIALEAGRQTTYSNIAIKIQTPQGLAAGNLSLPWRPDTDILTVHRLLIRRGDQVIDVLASGQTFTVVRREQNLESAMLDGVLTANIQPEGLQVGDVLDLAMSISASDPTLQGHLETLAAAWNDVPIGRVHLRMQWPSSLRVRLRQNGDLPPLKPVNVGGLTAVEMSRDDLEPMMLPKGAPSRYRVGRLLEATDFASWSELGALMAPFYTKAAKLPADGPLRAEVDKIRAMSADPMIRAQAALALVQDRLRYVALAMGTGGYVPADAASSWARRYGDCKAKTALLLGLLTELNIQAEPVAVSTVLGDGVDERLPLAGLFNHVLIRATIAGKVFWLDGTRTGDTDLSRLAVPPYGWGLPLVARNAALVRIMPPPLDAPTQSVSITIDARAGLTIPASTKVVAVFRGDDAIGTRAAIANLAGTARDQALRDYWKGQYDFIDVTTATASFDPKTGEQRLMMEGKARMDWSSGWYETDGTAVGYKADFSRPAGVNRDAPFAVAYPYYTQNIETILLPKGFRGVNPDNAEVSRTVAGIEYRRHATLEKEIFRIEKSERSIQPEFAAKDASTAETDLRALYKQTVYVRRPDDYASTEQENQALIASVPTTAAAHSMRGFLLMQRGSLKEALADFDAAIELDPKQAGYVANRAMAKVSTADYAGAHRDLDAAAALDPKNPFVARVKGELAFAEGRFAEAIAAYTDAIALNPGDTYVLGRRAQANHALGDDGAALADAAAVLVVAPTRVDLRLMRANIFRGAGDADAAIKEADTIAAAGPDDVDAQVTAAMIYSRFRREVQAARAFDRAIAIRPEAATYVDRSRSRPKEDVAGRRSDLDAALKLSPTDDSALVSKAELLAETGDLAGALAIYTSAIARRDDADLLVRRGLVYSRMKDTAHAEADFSVARAKVSAPSALNNMCWTKAVAGVALESALGDCNKALAKMPDEAQFLDSRGFVLLRLGRLDDALTDYDRALAIRPDSPSSHYGRALVWAKKGNKAKSDADAAAALKKAPETGTNFASYGVTL